MLQSRRRFPGNLVLSLALPCLLLALCLRPNSVLAQSTFGSIIGTVTDSSGSLIPGATVTLLNAGTAATRTATTSKSGEYTFVNIDYGKYQLTVDATGFEAARFDGLDLQAREVKRVDAKLVIGASSQTVTVQDTSAGVITTDVSNLSETKTGLELTTLPVAVYSRSTGSTSPIDTLSTEPGVQVDDSNNLVIDGTTPALMSYTIDGISSVDVENSGPINELFPSFNSISEITISGSNNNAEFSGVADVTTTSKAGTNNFHGGVFENFENTALNAGNPFTGSKQNIHMNDYGGFLGGPISIPHLYSGKDKAFFFMSYEGLRLPREVPLITTVPTAAMRAGNLTDYLAGTPIFNPDGSSINPANVPINASSAKILQNFFPLPNYGDTSTFSQSNYRVNYAAPISSDQADLRLDYALTSKQSMFIRGSYKIRSVVQPPNPNCSGYCVNAGSPINGAFGQPETDQGVTFSHNYAITNSIVNEFRAGFNGTHFTTAMLQGTSQGYLDAAGITGIMPDPSGATPDINITGGFMLTGGSNPSVQHSVIVQALDNLTWSKGKHTFKFGADVRRMTDHDDNVFANYQSGQYYFDGSTTYTAADGVTPVSVGDTFTEFLLGYPDYTYNAEQVNYPQMNGLGYGYGFYAQDDWKITNRLTLNVGLRYELHPPLKDVDYNTAAFLPDYNVGGVTGAVVVPNAKALSYTSSNFATSIQPSPILTAAQAHIPEVLRYTYKKDFGPRVGFAWRPYGTDKTVLRGGWGRFIEQPLGFSLVSGWAVHSSFVNYTGQSQNTPGGAPTVSFPAPFATTVVPGGASFQYAFPIHYEDPSVQQWNLTLEQDIGHNVGFRLSYIGSHGSNLETFVDDNQLHANTTGYDPSSGPFPSWGYIESIVNDTESNYNSMSAALSKRFANGLQFQASYMWTRDLSDAGGYAPSSINTEGGSVTSDRFHPGLDYGNVAFDRRNRFLTTYLYELPFGQGKAFLHNSHLLDLAVGGWQLGGVVVLQTGAFLTPYQATTDPGGTGLLVNAGSTRADRIAGVPEYMRGSSSSGPIFLNPAAFTDPINNSATFGNVGVGNVVGPGTDSFSMSLIKETTLREGLKLNFGAEASNVFNHRNYDTPDLNVDDGVGGFGVITSLQTAEGAGPRSVELTARISF